MKQKLRNCLFAIMVSLVAICWSARTQAAEGTATKKTTTATANTTTNKGTIATVNGTIITQLQLDRALGYQQQMAEIQGMTIADEDMPALKYDLIESLIGTELLYQESQKSGIKVDEKEINEAYEANKQKGQFESDAEFEEELIKSDHTMASYRAQIKQGLAIDHFIKNKFMDNMVISNSEAKKYYDDNPDYFKQPARARASHIMIKVASNADQSQKEDARNRMEKVMERLRAGEDFAAIAKEVSEDTGSKDNGGDLGYFYKGQTPQSFENAAFSLNKGEISDIVETGSGYHIIKLTDKTDAKTIGYEEAKNDIIDSLQNSKLNSILNKYIKELKIKSTIETFPISK